MIIDTSALVAILYRESRADDCIDAILASDNRRLSACSFLEVAIVVDRQDARRLHRQFDEVIESANIVVEPFTVEQARIAREAYRDFGKGSGHPAQLNFGDCFAYALAKATGEPLLFIGNDFGHTDIQSAI